MPKSSRNGNRKNTGRSNSYKNKERFDREDRTKTTNKECANDPAWYIRDGQLARDVASLSFNNALGAKVVIDVDNYGVNTSTDLAGFDFTVPGIMAIETVPIPGVSRGATSPINIAAKNLYSWVRHQNSGHTNYDSPDLMLYVMAMDSLFAWIFHLQRIYGVAQVYSQKNRYIGDALMQAMGANPTSIRQNLADFRASINMLIVKASAFCVPNTMSLFKRHAWMYSSVFADSDVDKCQMYIYNPSILHTYEETSGGAGYLAAFGTLIQKSSTSETAARKAIMPYDQLIAVATTMLGKLQASEDINIMSGDILKAYGRENLYTLGLIPESYVVTPIFSDEILDQIHNTVFFGSALRATKFTNPTDSELTTYTLTGLNITQDPNIGAGNILCCPSVTFSQHLSFEHFLDMVDNEPTPERVLVATRNMISGNTSKFTVSDLPIFYTNLATAGSDICLFASMYYAADAGYVNSQIYTGGTAPSISPIKNIEKFHKAPIIYNGTVTDGAYVMATPYGALENYTVVDCDDIDKMHQSAILSMLGVPV